jgi:hypothetical protein
MAAYFVGGFGVMGWVSADAARKVLVEMTQQARAAVVSE